MPINLMKHLAAISTIALLLRGAAAAPKRSVSPGVFAVFLRFDKDSDGALNDHEFEHYFIHVLSGECTHDHPNETFGLTEGNETLCPMPGPTFVEADSNNDSLLTADDFPDAAAIMATAHVLGCQYGFPGHDDEHEHDEGTESAGAKWGCGIAAAVIVSLPSLLAILAMPLNKPSMRRAIFMPLLALGVGALLGDSLLHLIPAAVGLHSHDHEHEEEGHGHTHEHGHEHGHEHEHEHEHDHMRELVASDSYVWKMMVVLLGIAIMFVFEKVVRYLALRGVKVHSHSHCPHHQETASCASSTPEAVKAKCGSGGQASPGPEALDIEEGPTEAPKLKEIKPMGYIALFADGLHNFIDGLALGAAFATGLGEGFATTLAVFIHEIPQELGDVALLINAGFVRWKLVAVNLLSASTCILGALVGLAIGSSSDGVLHVILSLTAGGFLYLALADMICEIIAETRLVDSLVHVAMVILGIMCMFAITFLEAATEKE
eukprot:m51a1_g2548 hypothetical protein (490) ;mRNA; f:298963-300645